MSVPVYLAKLAVKNPSDHRLAKIKRLCDAVGLADKVKPLGTVGEDEVVAIKLHFGEAGNDTYLHPTFVRQVVDCVKATGARPFLTDTCTLYKSCLLYTSSGCPSLPRSRGRRDKPLPSGRLMSKKTMSNMPALASFASHAEAESITSWPWRLQARLST